MGSTRRARIAGLTAACLVLLTSRPGGAQRGPGGAEATTLQALEFGILVPGSQETVTVRDVLRRAEVSIGGTGQFEIRLVLPREMVSADGDRLPLLFSAGDAGLSYGPSTRPTPFNPAEVRRVRVTPSTGEARLYLGATAVVAPLQAAGSYSATVTVLVSRPDV